MKKPYVIILSVVIGLSLGAILVLSLMHMKLSSDRQDTIDYYEDKITEVENQPDEIEYVEEAPYMFYTDELTKENIVNVLKLSYADEKQLNAVASMLLLQAGDIDLPWLINFNHGYCDAYVLYFDGSDRRISVMCYTDNTYVLKDTAEKSFTFTHDTYLKDFSDTYVEAVQYLLRQYDSWDWNVFESCVVCGVLSERYPGIDYNVIEGGILLDDGTTVGVDKGVLKFMSNDSSTGSMYAMYPNMQTSPIVNIGVDTTNWFPADTLNIVSVIEVLEEQELPVWEDSLVTVFEDRKPSMLESWTYYVENGNFRVTTIEYDSSYDSGINEYNLFEINLDSGKVSKYF